MEYFNNDVPKNNFAENATYDEIFTLEIDVKNNLVKMTSCDNPIKKCL